MSQNPGRSVLHEVGGSRIPRNIASLLVYTASRPRRRDLQLDKCDNIPSPHMHFSHLYSLMSFLANKAHMFVMLLLALLHNEEYQRLLIQHRLIDETARLRIVDTRSL
jgi:hypothetical protein